MFTEEVSEEVSDIPKVSESDPGTPASTCSETPVRSQNKNKRKALEDPRIEEAYKILKSHTSNKNPFAAYGQHIAQKMSGYSKKTQIQVEKAIHDILYQADMGRMDDQPGFSAMPSIQHISFSPYHIMPLEQNVVSDTSGSLSEYLQSFRENNET